MNLLIQKIGIPDSNVIKKVNPLRCLPNRIENAESLDKAIHELKEKLQIHLNNGDTIVFTLLDS